MTQPAWPRAAAITSGVTSQVNEGCQMVKLARAKRDRNSRRSAASSPLYAASITCCFSSTAPNLALMGAIAFKDVPRASLSSFLALIALRAVASDVSGRPANDASPAVQKCVGSE